MTLEQLEVGKLYQVYTGSKWVIGEYVRTVEAHTEKYSNLWFGGKDGITISPNKTRKVPRRIIFKSPWGHYNTVGADAKACNLRPVTEETLAEIARLKDEMKRLEQARIAAYQELKALCS